VLQWLSFALLVTRDAGAVRAKAVYLAIVINMHGENEVLGLWIAQTETARVLSVEYMH